MPYDVESILHYGEYAFTKDPAEVTVVPRDHEQREKLKKREFGMYMGQRDEMTPLDFARVNRMYRCDKYYLGDDLPDAVPYETWAKEENTFKTLFAEEEETEKAKRKKEKEHHLIKDNGQN